MTQEQVEVAPTLYEVIQVHPAAPLDLITAAYWKLTGLLQASRTDKAAEIALYHLTRSYQTLADHRTRQAYDQTLGVTVQQSTPQMPQPRRSSWLSLGSSRRGAETDIDANIDYYEVLRVDPRAHPVVVGEAYSVMRNYYLRLIEKGQARPELVYLMEEAYAVLSDPLQRGDYDELRRKERAAARPDYDGGQSGAGAGEKVQRARGKHNGSSAIAQIAESRSEQPEESRATSATASLTLGAARVRTARRQASNPSGEAGGPAVKAAEASPSDRPAAQVENGSATGGGQGGQLLKTLVSASAQLAVKGGVESVHLARAASRTLREVVQGSPPVENGSALDYEEEEAILTRLALSFAAGGDGVRGDSGEPQVLARLVLEGPGESASFEVGQAPALLGGDDVCDIKLPGLAAQQARLLHHSGQFVLHSLAVDPATCVQGVPVSWALLRDGDSLELGPYRLRFNLSQ